MSMCAGAMGNHHASQTPSSVCNKQSQSFVVSENISTFQTPPHFNPLDPRSPLKNRTPISDFHTPQQDNVSNSRLDDKTPQRIVITPCVKSIDCSTQKSVCDGKVATTHLDFSSLEPAPDTSGEASFSDCMAVHCGTQEREEYGAIHPQLPEDFGSNAHQES